MQVLLPRKVYDMDNTLDRQAPAAYDRSDSHLVVSLSA